MNFRFKFQVLWWYFAGLLSFSICASVNLTCFHCQNWDDPSLCNVVQKCSSENQVCIVTETVDENYQLKFNLGCVERQFCSGLPLVGEHARRRNLEYKCCDNDVCNNVKPGQLTGLTSTSTMSVQQLTTPRANNTSHYNEPCNDSSWIHHGDKCYTLIGHILTWDDANMWCSLFSSNLVKISNADENAVVERLSKRDDCWTGGHFKRHSSDLHWTDESVANYTDWAFDEPRHISTSLCAIYSGQSKKWKTRLCKNSYKAICQKNANI